LDLLIWADSNTEGIAEMGTLARGKHDANNRRRITDVPDYKG
jgi:hypothetical protein